MNSMRVDFDVPAVMRDGVTLRADVYRPVGEGPWPVLVKRSPYNKSVMAKSYDLIAAVKRGYIVVVQDTRGRFASDGEWLPLAFEHNDGFDTVEWAADLPGSNGKVGVFGPSYMGSTSWAAAMSQPPHLAAIAPRDTWCEPADGLYFRGGATEHGLSLSWTLGQSLSQCAKAASSLDELMAKLGVITQDFDDLSIRTFWELPSGNAPSIARAGMPELGLQRALNDPESMARPRVAGRHSEVQVPVLNIGGWFDLFSQGTIDNYVAMRAQGRTARLVMGPWDHLSDFSMSPGWLGDVNFGLASLAPPSANGAKFNLSLDWFDHFLAGAPLNSNHESGVDIFVMGLNQWRHEEEWPLARAQATAFYLQDGGELSEEPPRADESRSHYRYDPNDPVLSMGGAHLLLPDFPSGPKNQSEVEARDDVLVFSSAVLTEDVEVTGQVIAELFAATDGPSTDWVVRVCDVDENGRSLNFVEGITRVRTTAGCIEKVKVDLWSTSIVIKAGHRIRVQVTSSNFPRWDRNLNTDEDVRTATDGRVASQTIYHDKSRPSCVILPIVPA